MNAFAESAAGWIFSILLNGLWEGAAIALLAALVLRLANNANATTRASILAAALVASIVLPIGTAFASRPEPHATVHSAGVPHPARPHTVPRVRIKRALPRAAPATAIQAPSRALFERVHVTVPRQVVLGIVIAWCVAALIALLRLTTSLFHLERLKKDALPLGIDYRSRMERWTLAAKGGRGVRLCRSPEIVVPIAVGLFDAMILVPEALIEELSAEDVDRIVLHELAHLRRGDDWINAIERIAQALFFFSPGLLWIVGQLDLEREVVCDDWVLNQTSEIRQYATCLARVAEITAWPYRAMTAPGAFITRRSMSIRVERLLQAGRDIGIRTSLGPAGLALSTLVALSILAAFVAPSFAYPIGSTAAKHLVESQAASKPPASASLRSAAAHTALPAVSTTAPAAVPPTIAPIAAASPTPASIARAHASAGPARKALLKQFVWAQTRAVPTADYDIAVRPSPGTAPVQEASASPQLVADASSGGYIDDLAQAGYRNLSLDDLIRLKSVGVTGSYIRGLESAGLPHPSVEDLMRLAALGVDGAYVREMRRMFPSASPEDLASLKAVGVSPGYVDELRANGFSNLSVDDVRSMRAVGVDPAYIREMRMRFPSVSSGQLRQLRAVGVTVDYIDGMRAAGFSSLGPVEATELRALGVDPAYVRELRDAGYPNLSKAQVAQCRALGIDAAFIRNAAAHGFKNLTIDQLVRLKVSGIL